MDKVCKRCGHTLFIEKPKGPHIGLYCVKCAAWLMWKKQEKTKYAANAEEAMYTDFEGPEQKEPSPYDGDDIPPWEEL